MYHSNFGNCVGACNTTPITLSGVVSDANGPVSGITISFMTDCLSNTTTTDANGAYSIMVPRGARVTVHATPGVGVSVSPTEYAMCCVCDALTSLNFTLAPVVAPTASATFYRPN